MININKLGFSYGNAIVLDRISMKFEDGHIYGLLGENGVGKTTLLTLLCGLKKPQVGEISVDGMNPFDRSPLFLQDQYYLPDEVEPVRQRAICWAKSLGKFWPNFSLDNFLKIMGEFETDPDKKLSAMSAGQLKKTYISFALACNVKYLYMDEPTNGLDIPSKAQFRKAVMSYTREDSVVIISTHQVRDLENIIDPIVILDKQDVLLNASIEKISEKLYFDYGTELKSNSLYMEQLPGGYIQVCPNETGAESKVNVEALFNAVYKNKATIKNLFENE